MFLPSFLFGLMIGLSISLWRQYQVNYQLKKIFASLSQFEQVKSLSTISLVRRTIKLFKQEYQALQSQLEIDAYLFENIPLGYLKIDEENQLMICNQEARKILKIERWQPNELRLLLELVLSFELDQLIQQIRKTQHQLTLEWNFYPSNSQKSIKNNNGNSLLLKAYGYPLPQGKVAIFIENKQQLKKLTESRNRVFSDLSHELRTPLTSISLITETLLKRTENQEKYWVEKINKEINRLIDLVQNWLDISQLEENPYENLQYQNLDLKQLIISAWQSLESLAQEKNINFDYHGPEDLNIEADFNRLIQVFVNLFDNSIKHTSDQGKIQVEVSLITAEPNLIEINVIDSGRGFLPQDLPHVFERLYRGEQSRARKSSRHGSGLGLAIVKEIIQAHLGSIIAQNHPETGSAWLKITLPQVKQRTNNH